jgi:hypothetical protein
MRLVAVAKSGQTSSLTANRRIPTVSCPTMAESLDTNRARPTSGGIAEGAGCRLMVVCLLMVVLTNPQRFSNVAVPSENVQRNFEIIIQECEKWQAAFLHLVGKPPFELLLQGASNRAVRGLER